MQTEHENNSRRSINYQSRFALIRTNNLTGSLLKWGLLFVTILTFPLTRCAEHGVADHVVVIVWDGLRPDFVRPQYTPALYDLARRGTFFKRHHPAFVSSTEVNGTVLITGAYPVRTGIEANKEYFPAINWTEAGATEGLDAVRRGDLLSGGHYVQVPTLTEIIQGAGFRTAVAGTKPVALLLDRSNQRTNQAARESVNLYRGHTIPRAALASIVNGKEENSFPTNITYPNIKQDAWTTKVLIRDFWKQEVPKFSMLWLSDPDYTQHSSGPGSDEALEALTSDDKNLGEVIKALEQKGVLDKTDIFVVSDHGFSTIDHLVDLAGVLKRAGFSAARTFDDPLPGDILVVSLGGSSALYVFEHSESVTRRLVQFLQTTDFAGVILSKLELPGTFPFSSVRMGTTNAPDVLVSFRWNNGTNEFGTPGLLTVDAGKAPKDGKSNKGAHASLSKFDMRNTLVGAGPDLRKEFVDEVPSGNADLAPTILWILGLQAVQPMDGRVLSEALSGATEPSLSVEHKTIEASQTAGWYSWHQYLNFSTVGPAIYFDEGNGVSVMK